MARIDCGGDNESMTMLIASNVSNMFDDRLMEWLMTISTSHWYLLKNSVGSYFTPLQSPEVLVPTQE